jgi:hypothetical protein
MNLELSLSYRAVLAQIKMCIQTKRTAKKFQTECPVVDQIINDLKRELEFSDWLPYRKNYIKAKIKIYEKID